MALCGRSPQPIPLEGKPVSPETSQFYSERLNSLKCKNQLRDGRVSSGAPCSSWRGGTLHHRLAQLHPPTLLHGRGRVMLQPSCHAENSEFLDPPTSLHLPVGSPRVKNLWASAQGLFSSHHICIHVRRKYLLQYGYSIYI